MLQFIRTPIVKKLKEKDSFYHGFILGISSYVSKEVEYLSLMIGMEDTIFQTSVRSRIDVDHPLYDIGLELLDESPEGKQLTEADFLGLLIRFKVRDVNNMYSRLVKVEFDRDVDEETVNKYKDH